MSNCACVYVDNYDGPEFSSAVIVTARKNHTCSECRRIISPGERYENVTGKWDGCFSTFKTCLDCVSVRESFFCDGFLYGDIWNLLSEHLHAVVWHGSGVDSSCLVDLTPTARAIVCDMIEEIWNDELETDGLCFWCEKEIPQEILDAENEPTRFCSDLCAKNAEMIEHQRLPAKDKSK